MNTILITYAGVNIRKDEHGYVCLNDLWYASGKPGRKDPRTWRTFVHAKEIVNHYQSIASKTLSVSNPDGNRLEPSKIRDGSVIYSIGGNGGGTYAIREIALAYAGYLDVTLQALIYQAFLQQVDGVEPAFDMPPEFVKTFAGSSKEQRKVIVPPQEFEEDVSYWRGYADACKDICLAALKKGGRS